ncbi:Plastid-lipid associated protein PAP / fibrillin family protein isoform 1 [Hibiscus syriacus]|uniref:Plastid-lipid associated protein PAP / fibrillin family protein isoform 1 n=1 Tax=Hibiscus syriacus TaxID=106335 RepID=A0A6A3BPA7_HIBSY|nr:Plastid-lipid associated protein PAP / fibrillin family protein isoform 1 [Hibiscus syriacus]
MVLRLPVTQLKASDFGLNYLINGNENFSKFGYFSRNSASKHKLRFKLVGAQRDRWKLNDIEPKILQERMNSWLSKTQHFFSEVTLPLVKTAQSGTGKPDTGNEADTQDIEDIFMAQGIIPSSMANGNLSLAAIVSIEQFSRMNGLSGKRMQKIFKAIIPKPEYDDARNMVEYCCFRFLSRDASDLHPCLKEHAFQRLMFITMLAWENPYSNKNDSHAHALTKSSLKGKLVGEEAFTRIAPAISGVADHPTVHNLFKALACDEPGISLRSCWKRPVLKWENNMAWPGKLTLTDKALYFEKVKVGPFNWGLFDSGVAVSNGPGTQTWVLEFVDLGGELRRDVWHASISEIITLHKFLIEYGPDDSDRSLSQVFGSQKGKQKATTGTVNGIARLQALLFMRKLLDDPIKLVQFSFLQNAPHGDLVFQTLALNYWGGPLVVKATDTGAEGTSRSESGLEISDHVFDIDGSVYLWKWMRSPSWSLIERAAGTCKQKYQAVEKTQATIDAAKPEGIPSNIDLFKELILPFTITARNFDKLRRWEEPHLTLSFLAFVYTIIFRNLLPYVFPMALIVLAACMLTLKGLKEQGRLGRSFGKNLNVTLLKLRTILLAGQPQITTEVALVFLTSATILLIIPFKYVLAFVLCDLFTRELKFRREMVKRFLSFLKERWLTVPAAPVIVLPFEDEESKSVNQKSQTGKKAIGNNAEELET